MHFDTSNLDPVTRLEHSLEDLNTRIARLAIALQVPLSTAQDVQQVLDNIRPGDWPHQWDDSPQHKRQEREWEELRGLMVLRCGMMKQSLDELGLEVTYQLATEVEVHMRREGFKPGADGFEMLNRLEERRKPQD